MGIVVAEISLVWGISGRCRCGASDFEPQEATARRAGHRFSRIPRLAATATVASCTPPRFDTPLHALQRLHIRRFALERLYFNPQKLRTLRQAPPDQPSALHRVWASSTMHALQRSPRRSLQHVRCVRCSFSPSSAVADKGP